nr:MAG TPA: hypothetical protein [Caudoviricetes sp.]
MRSSCRKPRWDPYPATSRLDPQVQDPPVKNPVFSYILYIYRKFTHLLTTWNKTGKLVIERQNVAIPTKSPDQFYDHPWFKTGQTGQNWSDFDPQVQH